jgi:hypothetical protein
LGRLDLHEDLALARIMASAGWFQQIQIIIVRSHHFAEAADKMPVQREWTTGEHPLKLTSDPVEPLDESTDSTPVEFHSVLLLKPCVTRLDGNPARVASFLLRFLDMRHDPIPIPRRVSNGDNQSIRLPFSKSYPSPERVARLFIGQKEG